MFEQYIAPLSTVILIFSLVGSISIILLYTKNSLPRNILLFGVLLSLVVSFTFIAQQVNLLDHCGSVDGFWCNKMALLAMLGILHFVGYGAAVIFGLYICPRKALLFTLPAFVAIAINIAVHNYYGVSIIAHFTTWDEYLSMATHPIMLVRYLMIAMHFIYLGYVVTGVRQMLPIYSEYLRSNKLGEGYNLTWIYEYIYALCAIVVVNDILTIYICPATICIYNITIAISMFVLVDSITSYATFPHFEHIKLSWSFHDGWRRVNAENYKICKHSRIVPQVSNYEMIKEWILESGAYANIEFSMRDITNQFPKISTNQLIEIFSKRGESFQSFVREIRIKEAIRLIKESEGKLRYKDIYSRVGFSYYSSFARSFTAVVGVSPSKYISNQ